MEGITTHALDYAKMDLLAKAGTRIGQHVGGLDTEKTDVKGKYILKRP